MKITTHTRCVNPQRERLVSFDGSKQSLHLFCHYPQGDNTVPREDAMPNATGAIAETLAHLQALAQREGFEALRVLCKSTGGYERALLQSTQRLGHKRLWSIPSTSAVSRKSSPTTPAKPYRQNHRLMDPSMNPSATKIPV